MEGRYNGGQPLKGGDALTVIYADTLFLLNMLLDYLLLLAAARLAGEPLPRLRFLAGACLGGLYAVLIFVPGWDFLQRPACQCAAAALMLLAAYGRSRRLFRQSLIFVLLSCALGGCMLAVELLGHTGLTLGHGVVCSHIDLKAILLSAAVCYGVLSLGLSRLFRHTAPAGELVTVTVRLRNESRSLTALIDTGNTLADPVDGRPVVVADGSYITALLPEEYRPAVSDLEDPVGTMSRLDRAGSAARLFRLVPYRAVGIARGMLLAVRADEVVVEGNTRGPMLVALSPTPVSDGGGYQALIGAE